MVLSRSHPKSPDDLPCSSICVQKRSEALSLSLSGPCKKQSRLRAVDRARAAARSPRSPSSPSPPSGLNLSTQRLSADAPRSSSDSTAAAIRPGVRFLNATQLNINRHIDRAFRGGSCDVVKREPVVKDVSLARSMCASRGGSSDVVKRQGDEVDAVLARVVDFEGQKSVS